MGKKQESGYEKIVVPILLAGGVGILPTDTLYGIVGGALEKKAVERIYALRKRELKKPMIVLVSSVEDLKMFGIFPSAGQQKTLEAFWPGKVSVVFDCKSEKFAHLHRGSNTIALRVPGDADLRRLLKKTGPLVAPSANLAGEKPASTFKEAKGYFGEDVDFYVDAGKLESLPSTLVKIGRTGKISILRVGAIAVKK